MNRWLLLVLAVVLVGAVLAVLRESQAFDPEPIDIVYTWVDGNDPSFEEEKRLWADATGAHVEATGSSRFENAEELKYSLRSLDVFFPHFRNVYIVVKDGQMPPYIKPHPQLHIVPHSQLIDRKYLPTFSSLCIEMFLHRIPGLSERYLYFNDDIFFLRPLERTDFYDESGVPRVSYDDTCMEGRCSTTGSVSDAPAYSLVNLCSWNMSIWRELFLSDPTPGFQNHICAPCRRSWDVEIEDRLNTPLSNGAVPWELTASSKFRSVQNAAVNSILRPLHYRSKGAQSFKGQSSMVELSESIDPAEAKKELQKKSSGSFALMCVNTIAPVHRPEFKRFMEELLPRKSRFEK